MFPTRKATFVVVLGVLVLAGVLGLGEYPADVGDVLIWLLCALLLAAQYLARWGALLAEPPIVEVYRDINTT